MRLLTARFLLKMMNEVDCSEALRSPVIDHFQWGIIKLENNLEGKDLKLYPGGKYLQLQIGIERLTH